MSQSSQHASSTVPVHDPSMTDEHMAESGGDAAHFSGADAAQFSGGPEQSIPSTIILDPSIASTVPVGQSQDPSFSRIPLPDQQSSSSQRFTPSVMDALEERSLAGSFAGFQGTEVQRSGSPSGFVSRREALSMARSLDQQTAAASQELANVRGQIAQLQDSTVRGIQSTAGRQDELAAHLENRVAQSVVEFERLGAQSAARAAQAETSSAAALRSAQHASVVGAQTAARAVQAETSSAAALRAAQDASVAVAQAQNVASQAHSEGSEARRRTHELAQKQSRDIETLQAQLASVQNTQRVSNNLIKQVQDALKDTKDQLSVSQQTVTSLHGQVQTERDRVAELQRQLETERVKTTELTASLQQVQVDAAAQSMLRQENTTAGTGGMLNPELVALMEQQRELLQGYQELARVQSQRQASTSLPASPSGSRLQIQMRPKEPPSFSGKKDQDVDIWLHQIDDYFALTKPTDSDGVAYLVLQLSGFARDWWEAEIKSAHGRYPSTIEEMKVLLRAAFSSPLHERKARAEIRNLRQGQNEDYREYAARYKSLLARLPLGSYSDAVALDDWVFGLTPPYGERVMALKPKTLNEAIATMGELDIAHQFCRRDGGRSQQKTDGGGDQKKSKKGKQQKGSGGGQPVQKGGSTGDGSSGGYKGKQGTSAGKGSGPSDGSKSLKCFYCGKPGHRKSECRKFQRDVQAKFAVLKAGVSTSGPGAPSGSGQQPDRKDGHPQGN